MYKFVLFAADHKDAKRWLMEEGVQWYLRNKEYLIITPATFSLTIGIRYKHSFFTNRFGYSLTTNQWEQLKHIEQVNAMKNARENIT